MYRYIKFHIITAPSFSQCMSQTLSSESSNSIVLELYCPWTLLASNSIGLELYWPRTLLASNSIVLELYCPRTLLSSNSIVLEPYWPRTVMSSNSIVLEFYWPRTLLSSNSIGLELYCPRSLRTQWWMLLFLIFYKTQLKKTNKNGWSLKFSSLRLFLFTILSTFLHL